MKIVVLGAAVIAAGAVLISLYVGARTRGLETYCRNNLRQLGALAWNNRDQIDPRRSGRDFWQAVREAQYQDVRKKWQPIDPNPFVCPVHGTTASKVDDASTIDYRGPVTVREGFRSLPKTEPIGADRIGNHFSGGFVLRLDMSVDDVQKLIDREPGDGELWRLAATVLKD